MLFALLKGVGPGSPPVENQGQADSFQQFGSDIDADNVKRSLLTEDLSDELHTYPVSLQMRSKRRKRGKRTPGAEVAAKIRAPKYAAPLWLSVPVALSSAPTP